MGMLILALATSGDARRQPPATTASKARVRLILDTNFGDALMRQYEHLLPNVQVEQANVVGSSATVNAIQEGKADPQTRSVDHAIARLRRKIEADPHHPQFIHTVYAGGYLMSLRATDGPPREATS
jgi:DNA-binding response OmpR family regulator